MATPPELSTIAVRCAVLVSIRIMASSQIVIEDSGTGLSDSAQARLYSLLLIVLCELFENEIDIACPAAWP